MKNLPVVIAVAVCSVLVACSGGGGGSTPQSVPAGSATGTVFDGLILNGTVTAYDYSNGTKGAVLGAATTDSQTGHYSLSIQVESRPILLEITGGYYNEEMAPTTNIPLDPTDKMQAVVNYTTGSSITTSISAYTTAAAGLAAYEIKKGTAVTTAIDDANKRFSNLVGFDIVKTVPLEITDIANASATLTPGLQYGFLAGGISMWVSKNYPNPTGTVPTFQKPYISIKFVQLMYADISADGLLDGLGVDTGGNPVQLSFGTVALSPTIYRQGIGVSMLQMADDTKNKTGLNSSKVLPFGQAFAGSTDPMFGGVSPIAISSPTVTITAPAPMGWIGTTTNVTANVADYVGLSSASLTIDNTPIATITTNVASASFPVDTTKYTDGTHTFAITATNTAGLSTTSTVTAQIDNTAPSMPQPIASGYNSCTISGFASDSGSGPQGQVSAYWYNPFYATPGVTATANLAGNNYSITFSWRPTFGSYPGSVFRVQITGHDALGNTTTANYPLPSYENVLPNGAKYWGCQ